MKPSIFKYLLSQGGVSFLFRIIGMLLGFTNIWLISHYYSAETYGIFSLVQTVILILLMVFTLGVQNILIIEISKESFKENNVPEYFLGKIMKLILLISVLPVSVLFFGSEILSSLFNNFALTKHFEILALALPFLLLHEVVLYYFIALKKFIRFGFFMFFLPSILFTIFLFSFKHLLKDSYYITVLFCLSFVITFIAEFSIVFFRRPHLLLSSLQLKSYVKILKTSVPMMFSGLMVLLLNWTDILMLGIMTNEREVGIYNAAFKIGFLVLIVTATMNVIIVPKISEFYQKEDLKELKKIINRTTQLVVILTFPIVLFLFVFGKYLLAQFGADFTEGYTVLLLITVSAFFSSLCGNVDQILNLTNNQNILLRINIVCVLLNIVLNYVFIGLYGIEGAAIASLIATVFLNATCVVFIKRELGFYTFF